MERLQSRPAPGPGARAGGRLARPRRARRRPRRRLRRLRHRRPARRSRPRPADEGEARLRRGQGGRAPQPELGADRRRLYPRRGAVPGRAVAGAPVRAPAGREGRPGRRRAAPPRPPRGVRAGADRARARAVALPQQARVLIRRPRELARARLPPPRLLGRDRRRRRLQARLGSQQRRPQRGPRVGARRGPPRLRERAADRRAAQPRRSRRPAHGSAPDPAGRPRRRSFRARPSTCTP